MRLLFSNMKEETEKWTARGRKFWSSQKEKNGNIQKEQT